MNAACWTQQLTDFDASDQIEVLCTARYLDKDECKAWKNIKGNQILVFAFDAGNLNATRKVKIQGRDSIEWAVYCIVAIYTSSITKARHDMQITTRDNTKSNSLETDAIDKNNHDPEGMGCAGKHDDGR